MKNRFIQATFLALKSIHIMAHFVLSAIKLSNG
jgi:hypothetical protein